MLCIFFTLYFIMLIILNNMATRGHTTTVASVRMSAPAGTNGDMVSMVHSGAGDKAVFTYTCSLATLSALLIHIFFSLSFK